jgi:hypothetical protein
MNAVTVNAVTVNAVTVELSDAEALVLFAFLARFAHEERLVIEDEAEGRVLWKMHAFLERRLIAPLDTRYDEILEAARDLLRGEAKEMDRDRSDAR